MKKETIWKISLVDPVIVVCSTFLVIEDIMPFWLWIVIVLLCEGASVVMAQVEKESGNEDNRDD